MKELYLNKTPYVFNGVSGDPGKTPFTVIGFPFDSTSSFRAGSRFGPYYIRLASQNLELYSFRAGVDVEDFLLVDEGDVFAPHGDVEAALNALSSTVEDLIREGRVPITLGGEHLQTLGIIKGIQGVGEGKVCMIMFDAHADFRDEYLGVRLSHACVGKRIAEVIGGSSLFIVGLRAISTEELKELRKYGVNFMTSSEVNRLGAREVARRVDTRFNSCNRIYVSIDMDVFDPAYAPGVGNPEPEGLTPTDVLDALNYLIDERIVGLDVAEVSPPHDPSMVTSMLAAKVVNEFAAITYSRKFKGR